MELLSASSEFAFVSFLTSVYLTLHSILILSRSRAAISTRILAIICPSSEWTLGRVPSLVHTLHFSLCRLDKKFEGFLETQDLEETHVCGVDLFTFDVLDILV